MDSLVAPEIGTLAIHSPVSSSDSDRRLSSILRNICRFSVTSP